jgi:hypothetical protein
MHEVAIPPAVCERRTDSECFSSFVSCMITQVAHTPVHATDLSPAIPSAGKRPCHSGQDPCQGPPSARLSHPQRPNHKRRRTRLASPVAVACLHLPISGVVRFPIAWVGRQGTAGREKSGEKLWSPATGKREEMKHGPSAAFRCS